MHKGRKKGCRQTGRARFAAPVLASCSLLLQVLEHSTAGQLQIGRPRWTLLPWCHLGSVHSLLPIDASSACCWLNATLWRCLTLAHHLTLLLDSVCCSVSLTVSERHLQANPLSLALDSLTDTSCHVYLLPVCRLSCRCKTSFKNWGCGLPGSTSLPTAPFGRQHWQPGRSVPGLHRPPAGGLPSLPLRINAIESLNVTPRHLRGCSNSASTPVRRSLRPDAVPFSG